MYTLFLPPPELADQAHHSWSIRQAEAYLRWLLDCSTNRIERMAEYLALTVDLDSPITTLVSCAEGALPALHHAEFCELVRGEKRLTNAGLSLGADIGLLIAHLLLQQSGPRLQWAIGRGAPAYVSLNLPVIVGFADNVELDPILVGTNLAWSLLRRGNYSRIVNVYEYWFDLIAFKAKA